MAKPSFRSGIVFPQTEIGADPGAVRAFAETSESLGFDGLMIYDHVVGADLRNRADWSGWYDLQHSFHEIFVVLGYIAAVTKRIRLVTGMSSCHKDKRPWLPNKPPR